MATFTWVNCWKFVLGVIGQWRSLDISLNLKNIFIKISQSWLVGTEGWLATITRIRLLEVRWWNNQRWWSEIGRRRSLKVVFESLSMNFPTLKQIPLELENSKVIWVILNVNCDISTKTKHCSKQEVEYYYSTLHLAPSPKHALSIYAFDKF